MKVLMINTINLEKNGVTTFILSFLSGILGKYIARFLERWANYISGAVFLIIGLKILIESLL